MATSLPVYKFDNKYAADTDGFTFNLAAWLGDDDTLAGVPTATVTPSDATVVSVVSDESRATVWIRGGVANRTYAIEIDVVTASGRDCRIRGTFGVDP